MRNQESGIRNQVKCYVINLDRSKDRLEHITRIFDEQGLVFERIAAVDGALLSDEAFELLNENCVFPRKLSKAEIGCFLSHRECLRQIVQSDALYGAVFEDDILFSKNIKAILKNSDWIPNDTDIVKLDTNPIHCILGNSRPVNLGQISDISYQIMRLISKHYGAGGYILSRNCAKKLYELTQSIILPIDDLYFNPDYGVLQEFNVQQLVPAVVAHEEGNKSTISVERKLSRQSGSKHRRRSRPVLFRLLREIQRTYKRRILPPWLVLTKGYRYMKVPFN